MKVVFAAIGAYGHLYPMLPLALACRDAGHEVVVATAGPFLGRLPLRTVPAYDPSLTIGWAVSETRRRHPQLRDDELSLAMFADVTAGAAAPVMIDALAEERPDLVVSEPLHVGALVAASVLGLPALCFSISLTRVFYPMVHRAATGYQADRWTVRGLTPPDRPLLAGALLDPCPPRLSSPYDDAPRIPLRSVAYGGVDASLPAWLASSQDPVRKRVYLTLGTVSFGAVEILRRTAREIAVLDVDLLIAVGPEGDPGLLGELPANVHVERFVPQGEVLRHVALIVHHGGTGTVLAALEVGLPQLILPQGADQPFNAEIIDRAGAGCAQANDDYRPGSITALVEHLLTDCSERAVAAQIAAEIAAMPAPADVIPELLAHAATP